MELWKPIKGYENKYEISSLGRIRTIPHRVDTCYNSTRTVSSKILQPNDNGNGYKYITLGKGSENRRYVHRLVAEAFIPNPNNFPVVNHKDEDKANNNVSNLEWCSQQYNVNYGTSIKRRSKKVVQLSLDGDVVKIWASIKEAERIYGSHIGDCCRGQRKTANNYKWKYELMEEVEDED